MEKGWLRKKFEKLYDSFLFSLKVLRVCGQAVSFPGTSGLGELDAGTYCLILMDRVASFRVVYRSVRARNGKGLYKKKGFCTEQGLFCGLT